MKKDKQNQEVFKEISSGKSLLELYIEVKNERDNAIANLVACKILSSECGKSHK